MLKTIHWLVVEHWLVSVAEACAAFASDSRIHATDATRRLRLYASHCQKSQLSARGNKLRDKRRVPAVKRGGGAAQCVETELVVGFEHL